MKAFLWILISLGFLSVPGVVVGQRVSPVESAAADFSAGKYQVLIERSKESKDALELYYVGRSYEKLGRFDDATNSYNRCFLRAFDEFRSSLKLAVKNDDDKYEDILARLRENNRLGFEAAQRVYDLKPSAFKNNELRLKANVLSDAIALDREKPRIIGPRTKLSEGVKIIDRPRPSCQACTRRSEFPNRPITMHFLVIYGSDKRVKLIAPLDDVLDAFTMSAVVAVRETKFEPALLNGVPVNFIEQFETRFSWY